MRTSSHAHFIGAPAQPIHLMKPVLVSSLFVQGVGSIQAVGFELDQALELKSLALVRVATDQLVEPVVLGGRPLAVSPLFGLPPLNRGSFDQGIARVKGLARRGEWERARVVAEELQDHVDEAMAEGLSGLVRSIRAPEELQMEAIDRLAFLGNAEALRSVIGDTNVPLATWMKCVEVAREVMTPEELKDVLDGVAKESEGLRARLAERYVARLVLTEALEP